MVNPSEINRIKDAVKAGTATDAERATLADFGEVGGIGSAGSNARWLLDKYPKK